MSSKLCYKLVISYDGSSYSGWQSQLNGISIQQIIQDKMSIILGEKIKIRGSGRTDAKVHAENQIAHFHTELKIIEKRFIYSLNALLPSDIRVKALVQVQVNFHAQYSATKKIYHYHLHLDPVLSPFNYRYRWHIHTKIDLDLLKKAAELFLGTHDFTSFANDSHVGSAAKNPVRTLMRLDVVEQEGGYRLEFEGDGFLYKMVRNITGFLVEIARGRRTLLEVPQVFAAKDRKKAAPAAPPQGLFLMDVHYPKNLLL